MRQAHYRLFRFGGEGIDGIDPVLYIVEQFPRLITGIHFYADPGAAFDGTAHYPVDTFQVLDRFLDADGDTELHILGCRAAQGHEHIDDVGFDLRKQVQFQRRFERYKPADDNTEQQQVGGYVVSCKPVDHDFWGVTCMLPKGTDFQIRPRIRYATASIRLRARRNSPVRAKSIPANRPR